MRLQGLIRQQPRRLMATQRTVFCSEPTCQEKNYLIIAYPFDILFYFPQSLHYEGKKQFRDRQGSRELFLFKTEISSEMGLHCLPSNFMISGYCFLYVTYIHHFCAFLLPKLLFLISKSSTQLLKLGLLLVPTSESH